MLLKLSMNLMTVSAVMWAVYGSPTLAADSSLSTSAYDEGLQQVEARNYDLAFVRPGIDFGAYTGLIVEEPALAFRTPDRSKQQFPLTEDQKTQFRDLLEQEFLAELESAENFRLVEKPGPDVLRLEVRVRDITATVPPRGVGSLGKSSIALDAVGDATLVLELRDSQSEEIFIRAVDARAAEGIAILQKGGTALTSWSDVEKLCKRWATILRRGLDTLVGGG